MSKALTFTDLALALRGRSILRGISGQVARGRVTAILGPNGAGKSTLLACLAGLRQADSGAVMLENAALHTIAPRQRAQRIGLLPQGGAIHWNLSVKALVALGRMPHGDGWRAHPDDAVAIARAMAATDTANLAERSVHRLSGGEQARVLLARVLAGAPDYILADEPLASLDPVHRLQTGAVLRTAAQGGTGVAIVLHDLTEAARLADQAILLRDGAVVAAGDAADVLKPGPLEAAFGVAFEMVETASGAPVILPLKAR